MLLYTIAITTVCWVLVALLGPTTDRQTLVRFYKKVRPFGPGWEPIRREAGLPARDDASAANIPLALLGWTTGCTVIWSSLFAVGNFLYGRIYHATALASLFLASGVVLIWVVNRLWTDPSRSHVVEDPGGLLVSRGQ